MEFVYVILAHIDYEGYRIMGVFSSRNKANVELAKIQADEENGWFDLFEVRKIALDVDRDYCGSIGIGV